MNKTSVIISLLLIGLSLTAMGQQYKTIELKPITKQGWKYFYDLKKVSGPAALEVPLLAINDQEVNRYLNGYKAWHSAGTFLIFIPAIYVLAAPHNQSLDYTTFWWVLGGAVVAQMGLEAVAHVKLGKAVDKYNMVIIRPEGSLYGPGASITVKF